MMSHTSIDKSTDFMRISGYVQITGEGPCLSSISRLSMTDFTSSCYLETLKGWCARLRNNSPLILTSLSFTLSYAGDRQHSKPPTSIIIISAALSDHQSAEPG